MPTISSRRAARSSALKLAEVMLGTAVVFSGEEGAGALRGGVATPLPGDAAGGVGLVSLAGGLFIVFCFGGISAHNAVTMSLWSQNVKRESSRKSPICSFKRVSQELPQACLTPSVTRPEVPKYFLSV